MPLYPRFPWRINKGTEWSPAFGRKKKLIFDSLHHNILFQGYLHKTLWQVWNICPQNEQKVVLQLGFQTMFETFEEDNLVDSLGKMNWYEYMLSYVYTKWGLTYLKVEILPISFSTFANQTPPRSSSKSISERKIASNILLVNSKREGRPITFLILKAHILTEQKAFWLCIHTSHWTRQCLPAEILSWKTPI